MGAIPTTNKTRVIIPEYVNIVALIPARGGSKSIRMKNIKPFMGEPLIAHSIRYATRFRRPPEDHNPFVPCTYTIVSSDSEEILNTGMEYGADMAIKRPEELAEDTTPMWAVVQHLVHNMEWTHSVHKRRYRYIALLDPTSPTRSNQLLSSAYDDLIYDKSFDGSISISLPKWQPQWHGVTIPNRDSSWASDTYIRDYSRKAHKIHARQALSSKDTVYVINGQLYLWTYNFVKAHKSGWRGQGKFHPFITPMITAMSLDTLEEWEQAEAMIKAGIIPIDNTALCLKKP